MEPIGMDAQQAKRLHTDSSARRKGKAVDEEWNPIL